MASSSKTVRKTYLWMVQSVQIIRHLPKLTKVDDPNINYTEEDTQYLLHSYGNALVIKLSLANFNTQWILVDNRSSADILYYPTF